MLIALNLSYWKLKFTTPENGPVCYLRLEILLIIIKDNDCDL